MMHRITQVFMIWTLVSEMLIAQSVPSQEHIIKLSKSVSNPELHQVQSLFENKNIECKYLGFHTYYQVTSLLSIREISNILQEAGIAAEVMPNIQVEYRYTPNDPQYAQQWHHDLIGSEKAWDQGLGGVTKKGRQIVLAVVDGGNFQKHEDLIENAYINTGEIPNNDIDDDNNGYKDDYSGYNPSGLDTVEFNAHGCSVTGVMASRGNNSKGITGVAPFAKFLPVGPAKSSGDVIASYDYVYQMRKLFNSTGGQKGAFIVALNASFGFSNKFPSDFPAYCEIIDSLGKVGIVHVSAAPNASKDIGIDGDLPSLCPGDAMIVVTNSDQNDNLYANAAFSKEFIDIAAPGTGVYTTVGFNQSSGYGGETGTSFATPVVTGAVGWIYSAVCDTFETFAMQNPHEAAKIVRSFVLNGVKKYNNLQNKVSSGGVIRLSGDSQEGILYQLEKFCAFDFGPLDIVAITPNLSSKSIKLLFSVPSLDPVKYEMVDILGRVINSDVFQVQGQPPYVVEIPVNYLAAGHYFIVLYADGKVRKKIFTVVPTK